MKWNQALYDGLTEAQKQKFCEILTRQMIEYGGRTNRKEAYLAVIGDDQPKSFTSCTNNMLAAMRGGVHHHKIGVISDTHIGSSYSPDEWLQKALADIQENNCECILHCGDLTEGQKAARFDTQAYEIDHESLGFPAMRESARKAFENVKIPLYMISGNHDRFFRDNVDIVRDVCSLLPTAKFLGNGCATMDFDGAKVVLYHGEDAFSNTRLKRLADEVLQVAVNNISLVFAGHVHKYEVKRVSNATMVHVPSLQERTPWMLRKKLIADCGYLIVEFDVIDKRIRNVQAKYYDLHQNDEF